MQVGETKGNEFVFDASKMQVGIDLAENASYSKVYFVHLDEDTERSGRLRHIPVTHGHLKEVADGADVPVTNPVFTSVPQAPVTRFDGWGVQGEKQTKPEPTLFTPPPAPAVTHAVAPAPFVTPTPRVATHDAAVTVAAPIPAPVVTEH